ncbi:hypothetical protein B0T12DRAFT_363470 [Alternaria alternata]|nr:hypothetical protein B0T12DRAFT_363470 [Alternaria alternata]
MSAPNCNCGSGLWATIGINLVSSGIFLCLCLLGTAVLGWRFGLSWPWEKAKREALVKDLEAANVKLANDEAVGRMKRAENELGREKWLRADEKDALQKQIAAWEKKVSDLQKELGEAEAMGFVTASGLGAAGPSTLRKRNPS